MFAWPGMCVLVVVLRVTHGHALLAQHVAHETTHTVPGCAALRVQLHKVSLWRMQSRIQHLVAMLKRSSKKVREHDFVHEASMRRLRGYRCSASGCTCALFEDRGRGEPMITGPTAGCRQACLSRYNSDYYRTTVAAGRAIDSPCCHVHGTASTRGPRRVYAKGGYHARRAPCGK